MRRIATGLLGLTFTAAGIAADFEFWMDARYDPEVPTFAEVLDYRPGERISAHANVVKYFEALAEARPDEVRLVEYAQSWEGRKLFYAIVARPPVMARLEALEADIQRAADPRELSADAARELLQEMPGTVWLSYSVHGNEISSSDAAMLTAYHLLASREDPVADEIRANTVVFIDPLQNPDGRDRFVHGFEQALGLEPAATRLAAEHDEPWPSGRVNHYLFDLNRDWLAVTQPETRGRVAALQRWYPLAFVDAHEMGSDSTYFFAPEAVPFNPHLADDQRANLELFGRNNARWFDRYGIDYFTREVYDAFYPGYGASWPSYYGGIAMTYEQASSRGLVMRRLDGTELHFRETVRNHFLTSIATAQTVAQHRARLWQDFYDYRASAIEEGRDGDVRSYLIPTQRDQAAADKLAGLLALQGVEVHRAARRFSACGNEYAAGAYAVSLAQPAKRLIRTVMDPQVSMDRQFLAEQERRRAKDLPDEIYDVTAWSLPLMFNVQVDACGRAVEVASMAVAEPDLVRPGRLVGDEAQVAYVIPGGSRATHRALAKALRAGLRVKLSAEPFTHDGRELSSGTLILRVADNPESVHGDLQDIARETGAEIHALNDSWITSGPNIGSEKVVNLLAPRIALAWDRPTSTYAPGAARFIIERQFGYPVVPIRTDTLARADLRNFDVVILPDASDYWGDYGELLGEAGADNLRGWVERGGVLVTIAGATEWAADPEVDLLAMRVENQYRESDSDADRESAAADEDGETEAEETGVPGTVLAGESDYEDAIRPEREPPDPLSGALLKAQTDPDHWLAAGVAPELNVLARGSRIFTPLKRDQGTNVARYAAADNLLVSGYLWEENRRQLAFKPFVAVQPRDNGMVIAFTEDPTVRAYLDGLNAIFMNALLVAPAHATPLR